AMPFQPLPSWRDAAFWSAPGVCQSFDVRPELFRPFLSATSEDVGGGRYIRGWLQGRLYDELSAGPAILSHVAVPNVRDRETGGSCGHLRADLYLLFVSAHVCRACARGVQPGDRPGYGRPEIRIQCRPHSDSCIRLCAVRNWVLPPAWNVSS